MVHVWKHGGHINFGAISDDMNWKLLQMGIKVW